MERTSNNGFVVHGRSDSTLNPGGVRIGTAEIYQQVEGIDFITEGLVVGQNYKNDVRIVLFVTTKNNQKLDEEKVKLIKLRIRKNCSPKHVPAIIIKTPEIPRTKSGKIVELAVRKIINGEEINNLEAIANPHSLDFFKNLKVLADSWRMAQEIDKAIPVLEQAAKLAKDGETFILLGNLYLFEDRLDDAIVAIQNGIKKGGLKKTSQAHLVLGQAFFELQNFDDAKKYFRMAARDDDKRIKKTANSWIKYSENEEVRVRNLQLRREFIEQNS